MPSIYLLVALYCVAVALVTSGSALQIAFVSSGDPRTLWRLSPFTKEAQQRGHHVVALVDHTHTSLCSKVLSSALCLPVRCEQEACHDTSASFYKHAQIAMLQRNFSPTALIAAAFFESADAISRANSAPLVLIADDNMEAALHGNLHGGSLKAALHGFSRDVMLSFFPDPYHDLFATHHVVTRGVPGLSLLGSRCPNIHPVGVVRADPLASGEADEFGTFSWDSDCASRFIYANLNAPSVAVASTVQKLLADVSAATGSCVLWRNPANVTTDVSAEQLQRGRRISMTVSVLASPFFSHIKGKAPVAVLSDASVDIVHDAVSVMAPLVLVDGPQALCELLAALNIGTCANGKSPLHVASAVAAAVKDDNMERAVRGVWQLGSSMGGAGMAIDVVELAANLGSGNKDFFCDPAIFASPYGYNAGVVLSTGFILSIFICLLSFAWSCCCGRGRSPW